MYARSKHALPGLLVLILFLLNQQSIIRAKTQQMRRALHPTTADSSYSSTYDTYTHTDYKVYISYYMI